MLKAPEKYRVHHPAFSGFVNEGNEGTFLVPLNERVSAFVICSADAGWEHVSVTLNENKGGGRYAPKSRTPRWDEMCQIKELFWQTDDAVIQVHPPKSEHVNFHQHCLHLWRPMDGDMRLPSRELVGGLGMGEDTA